MNFGLSTALRYEYLISIVFQGQWVNILRPWLNGRHFTDDTFKRILLKQNVRISIKISLKFVPRGPINNFPALIQIMAWRRPGDKSLSEPMMIILPTHIYIYIYIYIYICVTWHQWVNAAFVPAALCVYVFLSVNLVVLIVYFPLLCVVLYV